MNRRRLAILALVAGLGLVGGCANTNGNGNGGLLGCLGLGRRTTVATDIDLGCCPNGYGAPGIPVVNGHGPGCGYGEGPILVDRGDAGLGAMPMPPGGIPPNGIPPGVPTGPVPTPAPTMPPASGGTLMPDPGMRLVPTPQSQPVPYNPTQNRGIGLFRR